MGIWTHSLKFNAPATSTSFLKRLEMESTVFCRKSCETLVITFRIRSSYCSIVRVFARYTSFAQPHKEKSQGVRSGLLADHSWGPRRPSQRPGNFRTNQARTVCAQWGGAPSCMKTSSSMFSQPDAIRPHVIFQHLKIAFGIHGVTQKIWVDDPSGHHSAPHGHFWTILHLLHRHFGIVCRPVTAIMSIDETADMENGLVAPENVFKEFWPILVPPQHQLPIFHSAVSLQLSARARNGVSAAENSSLSSTPYLPCASTVHFREKPDVLIYAGCGWTYPAPKPRSPQIGMWMDGHFSVRP